MRVKASFILWTVRRLAEMELRSLDGTVRGDLINKTEYPMRE